MGVVFSFAEMFFTSYRHLLYGIPGILHMWPSLNPTMILGGEIIIPFYRVRNQGSKRLNSLPSVTSRKEAGPTLKLLLGSGSVPLAGLVHEINEVRALGLGPGLTENEMCSIN